MCLGAPGDEAFEHIGEPCHRLDAMEFGALNEGHGDRPVTGSAIGAGEERILPIQCNRPDAALDDIAIDLDPPV